MAAVTICSDFGAQKIKSVIVFIVSPSVCHEVMGPDAMIFAFWRLSFKPAFSLSSFTFTKRFFSSTSLSALRVVSYAYLRLLIFLPTILMTFILPHLALTVIPEVCPILSPFYRWGNSQRFTSSCRYLRFRLWNVIS